MVAVLPGAWSVEGFFPNLALFGEIEVESG